MIVFAEHVDRDYPSLPLWFEAERRQMLYNVDLAMKRWPVNQTTATSDSEFRALEPVLKWTKDFSSNVRLWRAGKLTDSMALGQAKQIERLLKDRHAWGTQPPAQNDDLAGDGS